MRKTLLSHEDILKICSNIGSQLSTRYRFSEHPPVFIGVMKGAIPFLQDLVSHVDIPLYVDYIQISSYEGTSTTGTIALKKDISIDIKDRDVIIVEDCVDTGISMNFLVDYFKRKYQPKSLITVALIDKQGNRKMPFSVDYVGYVAGSEFLVGYGLDYYELFRNVPEIFIPDSEEVASWDALLRK
jgi:hypoxanthine phosphoribosyltransferase